MPFLHSKTKSWYISEWIYLCQLKQWGAVSLEGGAGGSLLVPSLAKRLLKLALNSRGESSPKGLMSEAFV